MGRTTIRPIRALFIAGGALLCLVACGRSDEVDGVDGSIGTGGGGDPDGLPIDAELQADCFAGAWAAERAESAIGLLRTDTARAGDRGEIDIDDPHAHGTAEDRTAAFDVGLDGGPQACIDQLIDALPQ